MTNRLSNRPKGRSEPKVPTRREPRSEIIFGGAAQGSQIRRYPSEEFLQPMGISAYVLAKGTDSRRREYPRSFTRKEASPQRRHCGSSGFSATLQNSGLVCRDYDLEEGRIALRKELASIRSPIRPISPARALSASRAKFRKTLSKISRRRPPKVDRV